MSLKLVSVLRQLDIDNNQIMLNFLDGTEEMDAFVDVDGVLLMFELKDDEFVMRHARLLINRIAIYQPKYVIVISTKGISQEARDHMNKYKLNNITMVYIDNLEKLQIKLDGIVTSIRAPKAKQIINILEAIALAKMPISTVISTKIGIPPLEKR
jgi:hypothetical protein